MDTITAVEIALTLGALDGIKPISEQSVHDSFENLKRHIQSNYQIVNVSLEALEITPSCSSKRAALRGALQSSGMESDFVLIYLAKNLLEELEKYATESGKYIGIQENDVRAAKDFLPVRRHLAPWRGKHDMDRVSPVRCGIAAQPANIADSHPRFYSPLDPYSYPVWFGTTRQPIDCNDLSKGFKNKRDIDGNVYYGKCDIAIPKSHRFGEVGRAWFQRWVKLDFENDNLKIREIIPIDGADSFWSNLRNHFEENKGDALVFLHGYNNSFKQAAIRAAQIGFDLKVSGATAFFSWASKSEVSGYPDDVASIEASEIAITDFLLDFTKKSGASKIHLIAHSMGNRGLIRALEKIQHKVSEDSSVPFGQVILAAPDLDVQLFMNLAHLYPLLTERTTLYASPRDKAVAASKWLHGAPRVGITPPITVVKDIDTIKVEIDGFDLFELGHGYFAEAESILHDIYDLLRHNSEPSDRQRLREEKTKHGDVYWLMSS